MVGDSIPQSISAERSIIGAMILSTNAADEALAQLSGNEFFQPRNADLFQTIRSMREAAKPIDPLTLAAQLREDNLLAKVGGYPYLHELTADVQTITNIAFHCAEVRSTYIRREISSTGMRIQQAATEMESDSDLFDLVEGESLAISTLLNGLDMSGPIEGLYTWNQFIEHYSGQHQTWVVPGLVSEQDVWMILSPPGTGKTTMSRQMCWCIAAGIHPFKPHIKIEPQRTLLVDLEVDPATAAEESRLPLGAVERLSESDGPEGMIWSRTDGLSLRKRPDQQLLERVIVESRPKFVALGSLYKTGIQSRGHEGAEVAANEIREVFDKLRRKYKFALWLEHHMPKAADGGRKPNPYGSSVWEWWSSHGRVLERASDTPKGPFTFEAPFRGDRGVRDSPVGFTRGGILPWTAIYDMDELNYLINDKG